MASHAVLRRKNDLLLPIQTTFSPRCDVMDLAVGLASHTLKPQVSTTWRFTLKNGPLLCIGDDERIAHEKSNGDVPNWSQAWASGPATAGEHHQTVAGQQKLASNLLGSDRVVRCDVADDPADIGQCLGTPNDRHRSARFGRRGIKLAVGDTQ
jgi:hypothetical protein